MRLPPSLARFIYGLGSLGGVFLKKLLQAAARVFVRLGLSGLASLRQVSSIAYHIAVVVLSAGVALSLPAIVSWVAKNLLTYWPLIEDEKVFLMAVEIALAILLILFLSILGASWRNRKGSGMARSAGMVYISSRKGFLAQRRVRWLKEKQGFARDVVVIASTGFRTFVDSRGDLHCVLKNCREAKIMLLDPRSEGAMVRAKSLLHPDVTMDIFKEQVQESIDFLKGLKAAQKNVRLKLYRDPPFLKLGVLGDYVWVRHYHPGVDVQEMPEYLFEHKQNLGGLYTPLYHYSLMRWENPDIPEYDLDTDELVFRDKQGNPVRREPFCTEKNVRSPANPNP